MLVELQNVRKYYEMIGETVHALDGVDFSLAEGDFLAIVGPSGSGKSTLMHVLGFMDKPSAGRMVFDGDDVTNISPGRRAWYRANRLGFVFQAFNLLPRLNVMDNVMLPLSYCRHRVPDARPRAIAALERVGLTHRLKHSPSQLSGGERQRVSIARALVNSPRLILADEPTGNLDSKNVDRILELLTQLQKEGQTIALVTHDAHVASYASRVVTVRDGKIVEDLRRKPATGVAPTA